MSLNAAFNGALSGLQAFGKLSETISSNVANAATPGYAQRSVSLSSNEIGGGVGVVGVMRNGDPAVVATRRSAEAQFASADLVATFQSQLLQGIGTPDNPASLSARYAAFEASLMEAASAPNAPARLDAVVFAAKDLASVINRSAAAISDARTTADKAIVKDVELLNQSLRDVASLNTQITLSRSRGVDTASLIDQRQLAIDAINTIVPVREVSRPNGQVALISEGGAVLLDGTPAEVTFSAATTVTPYQSLDAGTLSGLMLNDLPVSMQGGNSALRGGTLAAQFAIRDDLAPAAQVELDAVARNLIDRLQAPSVDPTLSPTSAGLFTDGGDRFDAVDELGISNRLSVNPRVDPSAGGEIWRLRTGVDAAAPGPVGDARVLTSMRDALSETRTGLSGTLTQASSYQGLVSNLASWAGSQSTRADARLSFTSASYTEAQSVELSRGIDTDAELQNLLVVENAYAANARVLQVVDEMLDVLLGLG